MHERDSGVRQPLAHSKFLLPGHLPLCSVWQDFFPLPATRRGWRDIRPQSENIRPSASSESASGATKRGWDFVPGTDTRKKSWNLKEHKHIRNLAAGTSFSFLSRFSFCYSSLSVCPHFPRCMFIVRIVSDTWKHRPQNLCQKAYITTKQLSNLLNILDQTSLAVLLSACPFCFWNVSY